MSPTNAKSSLPLGRRTEAPKHVSLLVGDLRAGLIGALGLVVLSQVWRLATVVPVWFLLICLAPLIASLWFVTQRPRRRQRWVADVLMEDSSSGSAIKLLELVAWLLGAGESLQSVQALATEVMDLRPHPHRELLSFLWEMDSGNIDLKEVLEHVDCVRHERALERSQLVADIARELKSLYDDDMLVVLYGHSATVCDAVAALDNPPPIIVLEDRQYGRDSDREHDQVIDVLQRQNIKAYFVEFDQLEALVDPTKLRLPTKRDSISLRSSRRLVCVLGCDAVDRHGRALLPGIVAGKPSDSAQLSEIFGRRSEVMAGVVERHLIIVAESFKVVETVDGLQTEAAAPVQPAWWVRLLHFVGLAVPVQIARFRLYATRAGSATIVTPCGLCSAEDLSSGGRLVRPTKYWELPDGGSSKVKPENRQRVTCLVLDFNGVVLQDEGHHYEAFRRVCALDGFDLSPADYDSLCRGLSDTAGAESLVSRGLALGRVASLVQNKRLFYAEAAAENPPLLTAGMADLLRLARDRSIPTYVLSAAPSVEVRGAIKSGPLEIWLQLERVFTDLDVNDRWRHLDRLISLEAVRSHEVLYLDDSKSNCIAAAQLGVEVVHVPWDDSGLAGEVVQRLPADYDFVECGQGL